MNARLGKIKKGSRILLRDKTIGKLSKMRIKPMTLKFIYFTIFCVGLFAIASTVQEGFAEYKSFADSDTSLPQVEGITTPEIIDSTKEKSFKKLSSSIGIKKDIRAHIFDLYFFENNSPLYGQGKTIVDACDHFGAPKDCIILVAIAKNETDLCKYHNSAEMHNCWGFGGGGIYRIKFNSFEESIYRVTDVLVNQYGERFILDPSLMEGTFCGVSAECTGWGAKIKQFIYEIDNFSESKGFQNLTSYRI